MALRRLLLSLRALLPAGISAVGCSAAWTVSHRDQGLAKPLHFFCGALLKRHVAEEQLEELFTFTHRWGKAVARPGSLQH